MIYLDFFHSLTLFLFWYDSIFVINKIKFILLLLIIIIFFINMTLLFFLLLYSHKKRKGSLETWAVLLIFLLKRKISGVTMLIIHQNSKKW